MDFRKEGGRIFSELKPEQHDRRFWFLAALNIVNNINKTSSFEY